jgi:hypothetical protein
MDTKSVVIDPDGDTLIILPFVQVTKESGDATDDASSSSTFVSLDDSMTETTDISYFQTIY